MLRKHHLMCQFREVIQQKSSRSKMNIRLGQGHFTGVGAMWPGSRKSTFSKLLGTFFRLLRLLLLPVRETVDDILKELDDNCFFPGKYEGKKVIKTSSFSQYSVKKILQVRK